jgi:hypothetical protein
MKALPPPPSQLELWNKQRPLVSIENSGQQDVLRALAEILLAAAAAPAGPAASEVADETR